MYPNSTYLYDAMKKFTDTRIRARETYQETVKQYQSAKGSAYYDEQVEKARKAQRDTLEAARAECIKTVDNALALMRNTVSQRGMTAPTEEQLRILQMLKMRKSVSPAELQAAAVSMNGNGAALQIVQDIAQEQMKAQAKDGKGLMHFHHNYLSMATDGLPTEAANAVIDSLAKSCREIIHGNGSNRAINIAEKFRRNHNPKSADMQRVNWEGPLAEVHGMQLKPAEPDALPLDRPYESEQDFYSRVLYSTPYDVFTKAVN